MRPEDGFIVIDDDDDTMDDVGRQLEFERTMGGMISSTQSVKDNAGVIQEDDAGIIVVEDGEPVSNVGKLRVRTSGDLYGPLRARTDIYIINTQSVKCVREMWWRICPLINAQSRRLNCIQIHILFYYFYESLSDLFLT